MTTRWVWLAPICLGEVLLGSEQLGGHTVHIYSGAFEHVLLSAEAQRSSLQSLACALVYGHEIRQPIVIGYVVDQDAITSTLHAPKQNSRVRAHKLEDRGAGVLHVKTDRV